MTMISDYMQRIKSLYWTIRGKGSSKLLLLTAKDQLIILSAFIWRRLLFSTTFIAITGSAGKTTTKNILANILEQQYHISRTRGSWNHRKFKGLEMTILKTRPWHRFAVIEVATELPGDIASAARFLAPDMVIMLNISHCHIKSFKTLDALAHEKAQLLKYLKKRGLAIINQDDPYIAAMPINPSCKVLRFGKCNNADVHLIDAHSNWPKRLSLSIVADGNTHEISTRLVGTHWAPAVMAAMTAAHACGVPIADAVSAVLRTEPFWTRMQPIELPASGAIILRDEYHNSIESFNAAIKVLKEAKVNRKIAVFSDFSAAKNMRVQHRANQIGTMAAECCEIALFVGHYADRSAKAAVKAGLPKANIHGFQTVQQASEFLKHNLRQGDLVLLKGSTYHHLSRVYLGLLGDVSCSLESCSKQFLCDCCPELGFKWTPKLQGLMAPPDAYA